MDFGIFMLAMAALVYGADFIIKESERIALHFDISHFVIGARAAKESRQGWR